MYTLNLLVILLADAPYTSNLLVILLEDAPYTLNLLLILQEDDPTKFTAWSAPSNSTASVISQTVCMSVCVWGEGELLEAIYMCYETYCCVVQKEKQVSSLRERGLECIQASQNLGTSHAKAAIHKMALYRETHFDEGK